MALRFFWRCESTNLDTGNGDYSAGDTLAQVIGTMPAYNTTAAMVGTNGMYCVASSQRAAGFALLANGEIIDGVIANGSSAEQYIVFAAGWWVNFQSAGAIGFGTGGNYGLRLVGDGSNHIEVEGAGSATMRLAIRATGQSDKFATLTHTFQPNTQYGLVIRVDAPGNKFAIELYDAAATLIEAVEVTNQTLGAQMPWFATSSTGIQFGMLTSRANGDTYFDNLIISDVYAAPIQSNLSITHQNQYTETPGSVTITGVSSGVLRTGDSLTISGAAFGATQGASTVKLETADGSPSVTQTVTAWSATEITITVGSTSLPFGPLKLKVTVGAANDTFDVTHAAPAGYAWGTADVGWPAGAYSVFEGASPAVADGDQYQYEALTSLGADVTVNPDGTFVIDATTGTHEFSVRVFDQSDETWSATALITVDASASPSITTVDGDGTVLRGQVGATIAGTSFGGTAGTVTIGGIAQAVTAWSADSITITVDAATPLGAQSLVVQAGNASGSATVIVQAFAGVAPIFTGPAISVAAQQQNVALSPVSVAARFTDPTAQALTFVAVGAWPQGVTVTAASGSIQGTPSVPGTFGGLVVRAVDPDGNFADSNAFTIVVAAAIVSAPVFIGPLISLAPIAEDIAMTSVNVATRFQHAGGLAMTFSAVGSWPAGVVLSLAGVIRGTPTAAGTYAGLAVRATDSLGNSVDSNAFALVVEAVVTPEPGPEPPPVTPPVTGGGLSDVAIANLALTKLGANRIIAFGDDTKESRAIDACYGLIRDAELRRRKWRFALKRASLPALAAAPGFGYGYAYQLPADCLSILSVGDVAPGVDLSDYRTNIDAELYSVEGRAVLTDLPAPLKLRYKARITDPTQFDAAFVPAFASRLAYELAEDLTQSATKRNAAAEDYAAAIREAVAANAIEVAPTPIPDDSWVLARQ